MKKLLLGFLGVLAGLLVGSAANASVMVTVWVGAPNGITSSGYADAAHTPTGTAYATFDYSGPINFVNTNAQGLSNTFGDFFSPAEQAQISLFSGIGGLTEANFLSTTMSNPGAGDGTCATCLSTFIKITGSSSGGTASVQHDDGASLYNFNGSAVFASPDPTVSILSGGTLLSGAFTLLYVEDNGSPSILQMSINNVTLQDCLPGDPACVPVPEPFTLSLFGAGLAGAAVMRRRKKTA